MQTKFNILVILLISMCGVLIYFNTIDIEKLIKAIEIANR
jgi:hypothetical protein